MYEFYVVINVLEKINNVVFGPNILKYKNLYLVTTIHEYD